MIGTCLAALSGQPPKPVGARLGRAGLTAKARAEPQWQIGEDGHPRPVISFKFDARRIDDLPAPRPLYEIFVYSPRVEGIHLHFGKVARGGLRWSDRPQD